jgi:hypothetical protein
MIILIRLLARHLEVIVSAVSMGILAAEDKLWFASGSIVN